MVVALNEFIDSSIILETDNSNCTLSFLFHCAYYFSELGQNVMFISPNPINALPPRINVHDDSVACSAFERIQFLYPNSSQVLMEALSSVYFKPKPATVIIMADLHYYKEEAIKVSAALLNAAFVAAKRTSRRSMLLTSFSSMGCLESTFSMWNSYNNIWAVHKRGEQIILENLDKDRDGPSIFQFSTDSLCNLMLTKVIKETTDT